MGKPHHTVVRDTISFTRHKKNVNLSEASHQKDAQICKGRLLKVFSKKTNKQNRFLWFTVFGN